MQISNQNSVSNTTAQASTTKTPQQDYIFDTVDEMMQARNSLPEGTTTGIRISSGQSIMHLLPLPTPIEASRFNNIEMPGQTLYTPEEYQQNMLGKAGQRDTSAIIYLDGKAVAMHDSQGVTSHNAIDTSSLRNGGDFNSLVSQLQSQYGNRVRVESFAPGNGPTNAEAFQLFSGKDYHQHIAEQVAGMRQKTADNQRRQLEYQQQQFAWKNAPQDNVFKVNGQIIASVGEDGTANISTGNLLYTIDSMGKEREVAKKLFALTTGHTVSGDDLQTFFDEHFAGQNSRETFSGEQQPTREDISKQANTQYLSTYQAMQAQS
ncbi:hypothetical protein [Aliamphritea ceti]|uniref:hypothetical protein n=1 Tax=Aliamphritea ceti TaxID=1524258 RepID=UPI0021C364D1|nr:hypothetical protein [Aliamphritea ceti]